MESEAFRNTIKRGSGGEKFDYEIVEPGEYVMGLVKIKNCLKKKFQSDELQEGIQFTFRAIHPHEKCFVNVKVSASWNGRSNLFKIVKRMTKNSVTEDDSADEAFAWLMSCSDKWYDVDLITLDMRDGTKRNFIDDFLVKPARTSPEKDPCEYFGIDSTKQVPLEPTGAFEGYPDAPQTMVAPEFEDDDDQIPF